MIMTNPQAVISEARKLLAASKEPISHCIKVSDDYLQEGKWLHLIVIPTAPGGSALDFVNEIERIEEVLRSRFGKEILIVPAKP